MKILLIDDDSLGRKSVSRFLNTYLNFDVVEVESADEGWELFQKNPFPIVISDIRMPGMNGIELLSRIKKSETGKDTDFILITGFGELSTAIEALRAGAYDYLQKPVNVEELAEVVNRSKEHQILISENRALKEANKKHVEKNFEIVKDLEKLKSKYFDVSGLGKIGLFSKSMNQIKKLTEIFHNDREIPVLIQGETGTGKEVIARMIHFNEEEKTKPFIPVNCSAISPALFESELFGYEKGAFTGAKNEGSIGKFELSQGGTIFLDEIGDLPLDMQPKLLRVLQMKELYRIGGTSKIDLDVRVICATNRNLEEMIEKGTFRRDLFFRLNIGNIVIPPLRERKTDIISLATMFLIDTAIKKNKKFRMIHSDAGKILTDYSWPGNVRELQNAIERVVLFNDSVELLPTHLDFLSNSSEQISNTNQLIIDLPLDKFPYSELENEIFSLILKRFAGNKTKTAEYLCITRNRLNRKI
ncbi:MAG: sigma-54-dependent Fis family transcriptional regulator [Candidatus Delongbacteria bacterium]|nr:sigma-54-dependent Fis family transcriptional regulator [Candidatus Delongbacteria bacterium]MBN2837103.1 sigma-54-dependent Fis family transcriptional regulator [Candidatus Delongbacteria bacterium]